MSKRLNALDLRRYSEFLKRSLPRYLGLGIPGTQGKGVVSIDVGTGDLPGSLDGGTLLLQGLRCSPGP